MLFVCHKATGFRRMVIAYNERWGEAMEGESLMYQYEKCFLDYI